MTTFVKKTEPVVCAAIGHEAHEHTLRLLGVIGALLPLDSTDPRVVSLLQSLAYTAYPTRDGLYKQLGNLCMLRRESSLCAVCTCTRDDPASQILRRAPLLSPSGEQFSAGVVEVIFREG